MPIPIGAMEYFLVCPVTASPMKYPVMPAQVAWSIGSVRNRQMY
jgi:hypothetical protein